MRSLHVPALRLVPLEVRPKFSAPRAARLANEQLLKIGQPYIIGPSIRIDRGPMAAMVVRAIDQQAANAHEPKVIFCFRTTKVRPPLEASRTTSINDILVAHTSREVVDFYREDDT